MSKRERLPCITEETTSLPQMIREPLQPPLIHPDGSTYYHVILDQNDFDGSAKYCLANDWEPMETVRTNWCETIRVHINGVNLLAKIYRTPVRPIARWERANMKEAMDKVVADWEKGMAYKAR